MSEKKSEIPTKVKNIITLDWLEVMIRGGLIDRNMPLENYKVGTCWQLKKAGYGNKMFQAKYEINYKGLPFAEYFLFPRENMIKDKSVGKIKINNEWLYKVGGVELLYQLIEDMGARYKNVTRLDIAIDGYGFLDFIQDYDQGKYRKRGKLTYRPHYDGYNDDDTMRVGTAYFGSRKGGKQVTVYNKSKEIQKSGKVYIKDYWDRSGIISDEKKDVHRMEILLRNEEIKRIADFDFYRLWDFEFLACIMKTSVHKFADFYSMEDYKKKRDNVSRIDTIYNIADFDCLGGELLPKDYSISTKRVYSTKNYCKRSWMLWRHSKQLEREMPEYLDDAVTAADSINCIDWYADKVPEWEKEYDRLLRYNRLEYLEKQFKNKDRVQHGKQFSIVLKNEYGKLV